MKEEWIEIKQKSNKPNAIVAVSNTGCVKRYNGEITITTLRDSIIRYKGKQMRLHRLIATLFIPKTEEDIRLNRDAVDHKTHNPIGMNINDVRNLRWCTIKENNNFEEAHTNKQGKTRSKETCEKISKSRMGKEPWNKGLKGKEYSDHYKQGFRKPKLNSNLKEE